jgi:hypothetical protein
MHEKDEMCIQNFSRATRREEKTRGVVGRIILKQLFCSMKLVTGFCFRSENCKKITTNYNELQILRIKRLKSETYIFNWSSSTLLNENFEE